MTAPRNNLNDVRAKFYTDALAAPTLTKPQPAKNFKFKPASSVASPVPGPVAIPHAASVPPPQRSAPPPPAQSHAQSRAYDPPAPARQPAPKRPSLDGHAGPGKPSPKRARHHEPEHVASTSRATAHDDVVMVDSVGSKENLPMTPRSPRKAQKAVPVPSTSTALSTPASSSSGFATKSLDQLRALLATNVTAELDHVNKLLQVRQGLPVDQDPFLLEQFMNVLSSRNQEIRRVIEERELATPRTPVQANADLSQMSIEQLRILLVNNLTQELQHAKSMLSTEDQDTVVLQTFIDMLSKRNGTIKAEIASREPSQPSASNTSIRGTPVAYTPNVGQRIPPPVVQPAPPLFSSPPRAKQTSVPICIDIDDLSMEVETKTTNTKIVSPLRSIENTVATTTARVRVKTAQPSAPDPDVEAKTSPHAAEAHQVLSKTFGLKGFRKHQLAAITATLAGKDVFVLMPTGGGKSLCYQVPAVCQKGKTRGVTIVVSPLIALMDDQVNHLHARNVYAVAFNSSKNAAELRDARDALIYAPGKKLPALAYVTPEKLDKNEGFHRILSTLNKAGQLARFVVDEVHCLATWGRDFRDSYQTLGRLRTAYPGVPIMALTATAHKNNVDDIIAQLNIGGCVRLAQSFNRPNLRYAVKRKAKPWGKQMDEMVDVIKRHAGETGIIYCLARVKCEEVAKQLRDRGISAKHYHAGMSPEDKTQTQKAWQDGTCKIIVATIAFGMGIDKANVRFVIHHTMPKSLEGYYQETGRAGRDGNVSECVLFYTQADFQALRKQIWDSKDAESKRKAPEEKKRQEEELRVVMRFCLNDLDCRRCQVLNFFDETFDPMDCRGFCDNCKDSGDHARELRDFTPHAQDALRLVQEMLARGENVTQVQAVAAFAGSKCKDVKDRGHDALLHFGKGSTLNKLQAERVFDFLLVEGALGIESQRNNSGWSNSYLQLGSPKVVQDFLAGRRKLEMPVKVGTAVSIDMAEPRAGKAKRQRKAAATPSAKPVNRKRRQQDPYDSDGEVEFVEQDSGDRNDPDTSSFVEDDDPIVADDEYDYEDYNWQLDDIATTDDAEETLVDKPPTRWSSTTANAMGDDDLCHEAMKRKRKELAQEQGVSESYIASDDLLYLISVTAPTDTIKFKETLRDYYEHDDEAAHSAFQRCRAFLDVCVVHKMQGSPGKPASKASTSAGASTSALKPSGLNAETLSKFRFKKP